MRWDHNRLDPRSKFAFLIVVVSLTVWASTLEALAVMAAAVVVAVAVGRGLPVRDWLEFVRPLKLLILAIFVLNAFFYAEGPVLWSGRMLPVSLTEGGLLTSSLIVVRLLIIAGVAAWFARTTTAEEFEVALVSLRVPWSLAFVLSLTLRLVPEMQDRYQMIEDTQRARGLDLEGGPLRRARARIPTLIPFFVAAIEFGYELTDALQVRDFGRATSRTYTVTIAHRPADVGLYVAAVALVAGFLVAFG